MLRDIFVVIGFSATVSIIFALICVACIEIKEGIRNLKWRYKYKHRFDKPPTAACYCKDCKMHNSVTCRCGKFEWCTADNWFCWDADPREKEPKHEQET